LKVELAEEKSQLKKKTQSLHSQKLSSQLVKQMYLMKERKIVTLSIIKMFPIPKHFDKLKPEPGPTRKAQPDLQL